MRNTPHMAGVLALAVCIGCTDERGTANIVAPRHDQLSAASGPSASGHGNWTNPAGEGVSRSFHGREQDGVVTGQFVQWVTALNGVRRKNVGDITCLRLLSPQDAVLSGPILENANPALIGAIQVFRVHDDGEGSDAVDRQGPLSFFAPASGIDCRTFTPSDALVTPIEGGNIQVRP